ncbi:hypothetical protein K435DRAFT_786829 [Dendrothele bispora CBS 962.96]|uniref:Uncharacterized protein n=1 Tax=Dendrothele bispora (strain CBS 962.96) TaxID=1314807 RepID=A0A4S8KNN5_DENBC|nr:hypothetical protein K435DRAFT_786829 [Dendrothele bispora CBS 962.96]
MSPIPSFLSPSLHTPVHTSSRTNLLLASVWRKKRTQISALERPTKKTPTPPSSLSHSRLY